MTKLPGNGLRIAIYRPAGELTHWECGLIKAIQAEESLHLAAVYEGPLDLSQTRPAALEFMDRFCTAGFPEDHPGAFAKNAAEVLDPYERFPVEAKSALNGELWLGADLDVLIWLAPFPSGVSCVGWARYGVWCISDCKSNGLGMNWGAEPIWRNKPITEIAISLHDRDSHTGELIYRYAAATRDSLAVWRNTLEPLSVVPLMLVRRLLDVQRGTLRRTQEVSLQPPAPVNSITTLLLAVSWIIGHYFRRIVGKWRRRKGYDRWRVAIRKRTRPSELSARGFEFIPQAAQIEYADPFFWEQDGKLYLCMEEIDSATAKGHLVAYVVSAEGKCHSKQVMLREDHHLSYPFLLSCDGETYMVPESGARHTVDLYRCISFPNEWEFSKHLQTGVDLVDTTWYWHEGIWYIFTSTVDAETGNWVETFLFTTETIDGPWKYHPANPICSDVRYARCAGSLFLSDDGKLIRPAQDCSKRYGWALWWNEVTALSPTEYSERPYRNLTPESKPGWAAAHTYNCSAEWEAIDAAIYPTHSVKEVS